MKSEEEILKEFVEGEKWGQRIGSGDDEYYVNQVDEYVTKQKPFLLALIKFALSGGSE